MSDSKFYNSTNHVFYTDNGTDTYIEGGSGQNLHITCDTLTANEINGSGGLVAEKIEVKTMSDNLGLNQLSSQQDLAQNTSGIYNAQGTSCCIMSSSENPVRIACGGPRVNFDGSNYGGALTYSSTSGADFTGPVAYQSNTFCEDYTGSYVDISENGEWMCFSLTDSPVSSPPFINLYRWNGSSYSYNRNFNNFSKPKVSGNYIVLSNLSNGLSIYFFNGSSWSLQQTISTISGITLFDITGGSRLYFLDNYNHLMIYDRSGTTWTETADVSLYLPMDSVINDISMNDSGTVLSVVRDNIYVEIYDALEKVATFTPSYVAGSRVTPNGNFIFHFDGSEISIITKVEGVWTQSVNKTACNFIDNIACNNVRLVCGRTVLDTYGRVTVFHINEYTNSLVLADTVYADNDYNLVVESNYKDVEINATDIVLNNRAGGATYINGSVDILGDLDVGGSLNFERVNVANGTAGAPSIFFDVDSDTGIFSTGDGHVNMSINSGQQFDLTDTALTIPRIVSTGPYYLLNMYSNATLQPFANAVLNAVRFDTDVLIENTGITKSATTSVEYPGSSNAGSRFTNSSGKTVRIMVCWSVVCSGGASARSDFAIRCSGYPGVNLSRVTQNLNTGGYATTASTMFVLGSGEYFDLTHICVPTQSVSSNSSDSSTLQIYTLN